ncbi:glycosyltransferase family 2 protein [Rhodoplanes sp. SY1]|uniref:glycosyltransferase family 2 protein n=1 Tax=Rhodoplanes sp. SY1 TaxID=3166646 RepID=UPI0038B53EEA
MITVIIVTRNRAALLSECLESMSRQHAPEGWRVLVVDNGSTDGTFAVASAFAGSDSRVSVVVEPELGASRARNRGAREAATPFLLFVDDECTFPEGYVARAFALVRGARPACFGGPVHARFLVDPPRPSWYKDSYGAFSLPAHNPYGGPPRLSAGNLGVCREALLTVGGFPEAFGPVGGRMLYGEENALVAALWDRYGPHRVVYDPGLVNHHLVRPEKYSWPAIFRESYLRGVARGRLAAWGLDEAMRMPPSSDVAGAELLAGRALRALGVALLDLSLLRRVIEPARYPDCRNIVYERWTRYVTAAGILAGRVKGRREIAARR